MNKIYLMRGDYNMGVKQPRSKLLFADKYLDVNVGDFWYDIKTTGLGAEGAVDFLNGKKPLSLVLRILKIANIKEAYILDFFAGFRVIIMTSQISNSGYWVSESMQKNKRSYFI